MYVFLQQPLRQTLTRQWLMNWKRVYNKKFRKIKKEVHTSYSTKLKFDYIQCETYFQSEWARIGGLQVQSVQFNSYNGLKSFWSRIPYSREQKHVLLFRKSSLWGCYKPRHVTKRDVLLFKSSKILDFKVSSRNMPHLMWIALFLSRSSG